MKVPGHTNCCLVTEEFAKMRDEVPPKLQEEHLAMLKKAREEGTQVDPGTFNLQNTGIAGTVPEDKDAKAEKGE